MVEGGENGANLSFDHLIQMETMVAEANADVANMSYLVNSRTIGWLKQLKDENGQYFWKPITSAVRNAMPGELNGYPVARSNRVKSNLTKGSAQEICSQVFFANWADMIIGEWGVLEVLPILTAPPPTITAAWKSAYSNPWISTLDIRKVSA